MGWWLDSARFQPNRAAAKPETVKELQALYDKWNTEMNEPKW
jgi:hypothetical protein